MAKVNNIYTHSSCMYVSLLIDPPLIDQWWGEVVCTSPSPVQREDRSEQGQVYRGREYICVRPPKETDSYP